MSDHPVPVFAAQLAHVMEEIGELRGAQNALEKHVAHIDVATNERLLRLEEKVEAGFNKLTAMIENIYSTLSERTGAAHSIDYLLRVIAPLLVGILGTVAAVHYGLLH